MTVVHIVLFAYHPAVTQDDKEELMRRFVALKDECKDSETGQPYIVSIEAGKDNSPENLSKGLEDGFVVRFKSIFDRDFYVNADKAHEAFKEFAGPKLKDVCVLDFEDGKY